MSSLESLASSADTLASALRSILPSARPERFHTLITRLRDELDVPGDADLWLASAPGRTELAGNHTDHNRGRVLAASVSLDSIAAVRRRDDGLVRLASEGFPLVEVDVSDTSARDAERESTAALVRGVAAGFSRAGFEVAGFDATASSTVQPGSGLSSSASIEVLIGAIFDALANDGRVGSTKVAQIGQFAENTYFGKPSGLMDQVACATGGVVAIDFAADEPKIERVDADFGAAGLALLVVDTGANHADLTDEYAAIPADMRAVAAALGGEVLRDVDASTFFAAAPMLRRQVGDRAVSRAIHYYDENARVDRMVRALREDRVDEYLALMAESGRSSGIYLQNCVPVKNPDEQGVVIALALTEHFFSDAGLRNGVHGACRVHGGGFAGTIQVLLPSDRVEAYTSFMSEHLGTEAVTPLEIRNLGALAAPA
ncbi:MAG: galactokinase [Spirochaetota bacterium]